MCDIKLSEKEEVEEEMITQIEAIVEFNKVKNQQALEIKWEINK